MKTMRKLFTVLLALALTLALAVPAFAAGTGSITITNPQGDRTYTAYKIFDVTYSDNGKNYSYTISGTDPTFETVKAYADKAANGLTLTAVADTGKYNVSVGADFSAASFAQHLAQYLKTNVNSLGTGKAFATEGNTVKASGLDLGYYFVSGTSGAVCELATAQDIKIRDKNEAPQIEKTVNDNDGTVEIGQVLTYTIKGKVPSTTGYNKYTYQVTDTMTEGLTYNGDAKITIGSTNVTGAITNNEKGFVANVDMTKYQEQIDDPVVITYTATVNENAIQRNEETNTAELKYSNNPADKDSFGGSSTTVDVFSFNIVINKYATGDENTKLEGAKFVLKKTVDGETQYYKYNTAKKVEWVTDKTQATEVETDNKGAARFDGLEAGTYNLEETAAPAGYNQLTEDITIELKKDGSATIGSAPSAPGDAHSLTAGVANSTGTMLPETGGTGIVIFVTLGALAVICSGVFLVTNKRMSKESF